jgi:GNAT superfamily N-acetyltransferase
VRDAPDAPRYTINVPTSILIRDLRDDERAWANAQYQSIQFAVTPPGAEALVAELAGTRVGLGRLVVHRGETLELGGIWTDEAARGHGVARAMVTALLDRLARGHHLGPVWCIPFAHLTAFYQSFGFTIAAPPWPPAITTKVAECIEHALPEVAVLSRFVAASRGAGA